jgi:hypothetical protein
MVTDRYFGPLAHARDMGAMAGGYGDVFDAAVRRHLPGRHLLPLRLNDNSNPYGLLERLHIVPYMNLMSATLA